MARRVVCHQSLDGVGHKWHKLSAQPSQCHRGATKALICHMRKTPVLLADPTRLSRLAVVAPERFLQHRRVVPNQP